MAFLQAVWQGQCPSELRPAKVRTSLLRGLELPCGLAGRNDAKNVLAKLAGLVYVEKRI